MRNLHKYEELLPDEFEAEKQRAPVIYLALGPMEYHGVYNGLGIDPVKAYDICLRAAEMTGGIVFPMLPIGPGGGMSRSYLREHYHEQKRYPSLFTDLDTCRALYVDLLESFAQDLKFKVCCACGGHKPCGTMMKDIRDEHDGEFLGMKLLAAAVAEDCAAEAIEAERKRLGTDVPFFHGGVWETSMQMAVNREYARPELAYEKWNDKFRQYADEKIRDVSLASAEVGARINRATAQKIARHVNKALGR